MDKKIKKKIDKLRQHIQQLRNRLAGAKKQDDEPGEVALLESEIAAAQKQVDELQRSSATISTKSHEKASALSTTTAEQQLLVSFCVFRGYSLGNCR